MNQATNTGDMLHQDDEPKALSSGLNVLTILTFIGCALQLLGGVWGFISSQQSYETRNEILEKMNSGSMPSWAKSMMGKPEDFITMVTKSYENRVPILLTTLVAVGLCFIGALQMRKMKKQGYLLYVIGELLPFVCTIAFIGTFAISSIAMYFSIGIALLFILLYSLQRKNLVY